MSTETAATYLSHARYGKDIIRVFRVVREDKWHTIVEYNVTALLEGDIDVRSVVQFPSCIFIHYCCDGLVTPMRTTRL